jgi:hypothetical protein
MVAVCGDRPSVCALHPEEHLLRDLSDCIERSTDRSGLVQKWLRQHQARELRRNHVRR